MEKYTNLYSYDKIYISKVYKLKICILSVYEKNQEWEFWYSSPYILVSDHWYLHEAVK